MFDYKEVFAAIPAAQLELPQDAWDLAAQTSQGGGDTTTVELTTISGSVVTGPITEHWIFASGLLKSAVYYNTYNSAKTVPNNGAVMRILPLAKEPEVVKSVAGGIVPLGPCYSCHSLSANGQMLVAQRHQYPGGPYTSNSCDVAANPSTESTMPSNRKAFQCALTAALMSDCSLAISWGSMSWGCVIYGSPGKRQPMVDNRGFYRRGETASPPADLVPIPALR
jgi:hypothetical protein